MKKTCSQCGAVKEVPSEYLRMSRLIKLKTTPEQDAACRYLESQGQRFLVDFGIENAFDKAFENMEVTQ